MLTSAYIDVMIFAQTSSKERKQKTKNRQRIREFRRQQGYLRAVNGIPGRVRPLETSASELEQQILEKNGKIIPVGLDGTILQPGLNIEARFQGEYYRRGVVNGVHYDDGSVTVNYRNGKQEERVKGHLIRGLPFFLRDPDQQRFVSKGEAAIARFGSVFMSMLGRERKNLSNNILQNEDLDLHLCQSKLVESDRTPIPPQIKISAQNKLMAASIIGNISTAQAVLREESRVLRERDPIGRSPMIVACGEGHLDFARWLFKSGAAEDVSSISHAGMTAFAYAARGGHVKVCSWLIQVAPRGLVHKADNDGLTPMHHAAKKGHVEVCECLYQAGARDDIYCQCEAGYSPMHYALQARHMNVAEWLLLNGAIDSKFDSSIAHAVFLEVAADGGAYEELMCFARIEYQRLNRKWVGGGEEEDIKKRLSYLRNFLCYLEPD